MGAQKSHCQINGALASPVATAPHLKVFHPVIMADSVLVMNGLFMRERAPKDTFHDDSMFWDPASDHTTGIAHQPIAVLVEDHTRRILSTHPARARTVPLGVAIAARGAFRSRHYPVAMGARQRRHRDGSPHGSER